MQLHSPQLSLALAFFVQEPTLPGRTRGFEYCQGIRLGTDSAELRFSNGIAVWSQGYSAMRFFGWFNGIDVLFSVFHTRFDIL